MQVSGVEGEEILRKICAGGARVHGVVRSAAVVQAERRISRSDTVCYGRSLGPLVRARALRDDALAEVEIHIDPTTIRPSALKCLPCGIYCGIDSTYAN